MTTRKLTEVDDEGLGEREAVKALRPTKVLNSYDLILDDSAVKEGDKVVVVQVGVLQDPCLQPDGERGAGQLVLHDLALTPQ